MYKNHRKDQPQRGRSLFSRFIQSLNNPGWTSELWFNYNYKMIKIIKIINQKMDFNKTIYN